MNGFRAYPVGNGGAQSDLPGRPEAIRRLVELGLKTKGK
jgi:hypothetical protein